MGVTTGMVIRVDPTAISRRAVKAELVMVPLSSRMLAKMISEAIRNSAIRIRSVTFVPTYIGLPRPHQ